MPQFEPEKYKRLFEGWDDTVMKQHRVDELRMISRVVNAFNKTAVDLGTGYGRVIGELANYYRNVLAIDIDPEMVGVVESRFGRYPNVEVILGDVVNLRKLMEDKVVHEPVMILLENTLGTIVGSWQEVLAEIKQVYDDKSGEVILSLYCQQALKDWGLKSYYHGQEMNGEPDLIKTDFDSGWFESKTGYTSQWWSNEQIEGFKQMFGGRVVNEVIANEYWILHLSVLGSSS